MNNIHMLNVFTWNHSLCFRSSSRSILSNSMFLSFVFIKGKCNWNGNKQIDMSNCACISLFESYKLFGSVLFCSVMSDQSVHVIRQTNNIIIILLMLIAHCTSKKKRNAISVSDCYSTQITILYSSSINSSR